MLAVVATLIALLLPAVQQAREAARRSACSARLGQVGLGLQLYHDAFQSFPPGCVAVRTRRLAWSIFLLPYLEQQQVWERVDLAQPFNSEANRLATAAVLPVYLCPSVARTDSDREGGRTNDRNGNGQHDPGDYQGVTDYGGLFGTTLGPAPWVDNGNGLLIYDHPLGLQHATDGASHTLIVGEDTGRGRRLEGEWANGENLFDQGGPINVQQNNELWSDHPGGVQAVAADRSVRFLHETIDPLTLAALLTRAGGD